MVDKVIEKLGDVNRNTIEGNLYALEQDKTIVKVERAVFALPTIAEVPENPNIVTSETGVAEPHAPQVQLREQDFYAPFAKWLKDDLEDCTLACVLGSSRLGNKWGTPDVIGIHRIRSRAFYRSNQIVSFVSAEIKHGTFNPIEAYGQACAYLLFSHKVYLVLPKDTPDKDKSRIKALCLVAGLGFVLFESNIDNPDFEIRVRPVFREPDEYYLNEVLENEFVVKELKLE